MRESRQEAVTYVGADGRTLEFTAKDSGGNAYDLTDLDISISAKLGATVKIDNSDCTVVLAASGTFTYTPTSAEIDESGEYDAQVRLENQSGEVDYLERFIIDVRNPITGS
jgi:hypothetical protein